MSFDIRVTQEARHTRVVVEGRANLGQLKSLLQVLELDSDSWPHDAVLLDLTGLADAFSAAEQATLRAEAQRRLPRIRNIEFLWR